VAKQIWLKEKLN